ncbi:hypothetical protein ACFONG_20325 [Uliginosibacterium paludis]|uniref:Uncharacterized protein n=1 Tax=Uliginosibacterium paludis TaxID=1615952 RepID=A0ABV2CW15_9RHOO
MYSMEPDNHALVDTPGRDGAARPSAARMAGPGLMPVGVADAIRSGARRRLASQKQDTARRARVKILSGAARH